MRDGNEPVYRPVGEQRAFITPEQKVPKWFGFHQYVVQMGTLGRRFRDGAYDRDLPPGRHTWWSLFHDYSISTVDARVRLIEAVAKGSVPGPVDTYGQPTPPAKIAVPMTITVQLAKIDTLLNVDRPLDLLDALIANHVTLEIGKLRYDQTSRWVETLHDDLERYLQLNAQPRVGLQVLEVLVREPEGQTEADKRQLRLYQTATDIKIRAEQARASNQARVESANTTRQEAQLLGVDAWLRELSRTPEGLRIIEADTELRKMAIAAGLFGSQPVTFIPQTNPGTAGVPGAPGALPSPTFPGAGGSPGPGQRTSPPFPSTPPGGYAGPASTPPYVSPDSGFYPTMPPYPSAGTPPPPASGPSAPPPGPSTPSSFPGYVSSVTQPRSSDPGIDASRLDAERMHFPAGQYTINETPAVVADASGAPVYGYQFVLTSVTPPNALRISFDLAPGYPNTPPVVQFKRQGDVTFQPYQGNAVRMWTPARWLGDILADIAGPSV